MIPLILMFLGLGLIIWSLYLIKREIEKGNLSVTRSIESFDDSSAKQLLLVLDDLEKQINDMNQSFYELVSDLEGSFSIHDKELQLLTERMSAIEKQLGHVTSEIKITNVTTEVSQPKSKVSQSYKAKERIPVVNSINEHLEKMNAQVENSSRAVHSLSPEESTQLKQKIVQLRKEGHNLSQIAKILNIGMGELQLFIKLNTK